MAMVDEKVTAKVNRELIDENLELRVELARVKQERDSYKVELYRLEADRTYTVG